VGALKMVVTRTEGTRTLKRILKVEVASVSEEMYFFYGKLERKELFI
jgi:hypothetical protein